MASEQNDRFVTFRAPVGLVAEIKKRADADRRTLSDQLRVELTKAVAAPEDATIVDAAGNVILTPRQRQFIDGFNKVAKERRDGTTKTALSV
jgi:hypothetical protein